MPSPQTSSIPDAGTLLLVAPFDAPLGDVDSPVRTGSRAVWKLALAGFIFAFIAASLVCLSPRWYSGSLFSLAWQSLKMVFLTAAAGAAAVRSLWGMLASPPSESPTQIALRLSASWVFLPVIVMLYEADSVWMLVMAASASFVMALGVRSLLPTLADAAIERSTQEAAANVLPSLDGLPTGDSPLTLATWVAVCAEAAVVFAGAGLLAMATIPLCAGVFLFAWRWSASSPLTMKHLLGAHPPLWQAPVALVFTALCLIPFSVRHSGGLWGIRHSTMSAAKRPGAQRESSSEGYAGIILYPPPVKKPLVAPMLHDDSFHAGALVRPMLIPFDGAYWYFKAPSSRPSTHAHIAHAKPTDVNVHSTDRYPLMMQAHQSLDTPVNLANCGEIDLAITNADTRPGGIDMALVLEDSATPGSRAVFIASQPVVSSQGAQMPVDRKTVHETLRFHVPAKPALRYFNRITVLFLPSFENDGRAGAKISIDSFELLPRP